MCSFYHIITAWTRSKNTEFVKRIQFHARSQPALHPTTTTTTTHQPVRDCNARITDPAMPLGELNAGFCSCVRPSVRMQTDRQTDSRRNDQINTNVSLPVPIPYRSGRIRRGEATLSRSVPAAAAELVRGLSRSTDHILSATTSAVERKLVPLSSFALCDRCDLW